MAVGCGGPATTPASPASTIAAEAEGEERRVFLPEGSRCPRTVPADVSQGGSIDPTCTPRVESVEADLNQDGHSDLRRVYLIGCPVMLGQEVQPVLICREVDLNFDGRKDVFRYFRAGAVATEHQDWDFDGTIDAIVYFAEGRPFSIELDRNGDGRFEMQVVLHEGNVRRVKVDAVGDHHFDIHEDYWVDQGTGQSQLVSIQYDLQGDGTPDRTVTRPETTEGEEAAPAATPTAGEE